MRLAWSLAAALAFLACGKAAPPESTTGAPGPVAARAYTLKVPRGYQGAPVPLVLALHPFQGSSRRFVESWGLDSLADDKTFLLVAPDGTRSRGEPFWNASDACCDFDKTGVDDVTYLTSVIDEVSAKYRVDPKRIYAVGFSNGGFMSHRLACDASSRFAAIVSLAGAGWKDAIRCHPSERVAVAEAHGTADRTVQYGGGGPIRPGGAVYPGATDTVGAWAKRNGCEGSLVAADETHDFVAALPGSETQVARYTGCPRGGEVELWTIAGAEHMIPQLLPAWGEAVWGFLAAHPKP